MKQRMLQRMRQTIIVVITVAGAGALYPVHAAQATVRTVAADPQVKDDLFAGTEKFAQGATDVTEVNLDPSMLGSLTNGQSADVARKTNFVVVHSYRYPKPGMYRMEDVEAYRQKLRSSNWNCFVHVTQSSDGNSSDVCTRPSPNRDETEMAIVTVQPLKLTFVHISGNGSLADLSKLGAIGNPSRGNSSPTPVPPAPPPPAAAK